MHIFKLEHSQTAYRADLALYCFMVMALAAFLAMYGPREQRADIASFVLTGHYGVAGAFPDHLFDSICAKDC